MAGTIRTDLLAVSILTADQAACPLGYNAKQVQETILKKLRDAEFLARDLESRLPAGTAKTAMGTVLTDFS